MTNIVRLPWLVLLAIVSVVLPFAACGTSFSAEESGGGAGSADSGAGDQGIIGVANTHCSPDNTYACANHAQKGVLSCNPSTHVWTALTPCSGQQLCDSTPGPNQGSCQDPVVGCAGKMPGDRFCDGTQSVTCGPDLVTSRSDACPKLCLGNGQCAACAPMSKQCLGNGVETCQEDGTWSAAVACPKACIGNGECGACPPMAKQCSNNGVATCQTDGTLGEAVACMNQACVAGACMGVCKPDAVRCSGSQPQTCDSKGVWQNTGAACSWPVTGCSSGACIPPRSCTGLAATCGPGGNVNCCAANVVTGGTYNRSNDANSPATVSDFRLDNYEATVGRFRKFVAAYSQTMIAAGAGKNPNNGSDPGWDVAWNATLPANAAALVTAVKCNASTQTWTDTGSSNDSRPMNCIDWYGAYAFCIWDGGRLPTEAEWNYAAAGGSEQRRYPWSNPSNNVTIDPSYSSYDCQGDGMTGCAVTDLVLVGSKSPKGDGKWGQSDLAGNVWEWTRDSFADPYANPCNDCSNTTAAARVARGGGYNYPASGQLSSYRFSDITPSEHYVFSGVRCSRAP